MLRLIVLNFLKFIHLGEIRRDRAQAGGEAEGEGEADSLLSWEPNMGLNPRAWRS